MAVTTRRHPARLRLFAAGAALLVAASGLGWWQAGAWQPERSRYPVQGVAVTDRDGPVNWMALRAGGADFAYLQASDGGARDRAFVGSFAGARRVGLKVGALHRFDPCRPADPQTAAFVTTVPRDPALLPPAVELDLDDERCPAPPAPEAMASELTTFLNQIEAHAGQPAILKLARAFERRYGTAAMIDRNLWLEGDYLAPDYAGRPWVMWTANSRLRSPAADQRLRWVVVRP